MPALSTDDTGSEGEQGAAAATPELPAPYNPKDITSLMEKAAGVQSLVDRHQAHMDKRY